MVKRRLIWDKVWVPVSHYLIAADEPERAVNASPLGDDVQRASAHLEHLAIGLAVKH
jgi:hypothetical protein